MAERFGPRYLNLNSTDLRDANLNGMYFRHAFFRNADLTRAFRAMIPSVKFRHGEGNSDAHLLSTMIGTSLSWPYRDGRLVLGTWQGVYFIELDGPRTRTVSVWIT